MAGVGLETGSSSVAVGSITGLGTGVATWLATPSSANLAAAVTGETGTGALVFGTSPAVGTPSLTLLKEAFTASDTLTTAESGKVCTNTGASATVALTLPAATGSGVYYTAMVDAAQTFGFGAAGSDTIQYNATVGAGGGSLTTNVAGRVVTIVDYASGKWMAKDTIGAWTVA